MYKRYYSVIGLLACLASCTKSDQGPAVLAAFTLSRSVVEVGEQLQATNTSQNAASYRWQAKGMQDSVKVEANPTFKAGTKPGTYSVKLTASNTNERRAEAVVPIRIGWRMISALRLTAFPATRPTGQPWHADGTGLNLSCKIYSGSSRLGIKMAEAGPYPNIQATSLPLTWNLAGPYNDGVMSIELSDNVAGEQNHIVTLPLTTTGPPSNRDKEGKGSYAVQYNGWAVVVEVETR